jgi:hypothetical protein
MDYVPDISIERLRYCAGDFKVGLEFFGTAILESLIIDVDLCEKDRDEQDAK